MARLTEYLTWVLVLGAALAIGLLIRQNRDIRQAVTKQLLGLQEVSPGKRLANTLGGVTLDGEFRTLEWPSPSQRLLLITFSRDVRLAKRTREVGRFS